MAMASRRRVLVASCQESAGFKETSLQPGPLDYFFASKVDTLRSGEPRPETVPAHPSSGRNAFLSAAPVDEEPLITTIQPNDWNRMVEAQIDGAVEVRSQIAKFGLEFPVIPVAQGTGRPFLWPLTQLDSRSFHRFLLQQEGVEGRVFPSNVAPAQAGEPPILLRAHHESLRPIHEPAPYSSLIDPLHRRNVTHFREKRWPKWRAGSTLSSSASLLTKVRGEIKGTRRRGELWEPTTMLSWMMVYKLLFVIWMHRIGEDFYRVTERRF